MRSEADGSKEHKKIMQTLGITVPIKRMVRAAVVRWYRHVLRREEGNILKEALNFEITGRKKGEDLRLSGIKLG